ncbi:MAG: hypothetical protein C0596_15625 [Marinilabiliales bacterium]|nr:MAG: hypothetical protein C0596_15625 [Marinilabiliales bacterium]
MKKTIHKSNTRGFADHGWLKATHTFSFASYYDPNRTRFGILRVLNDDIIAGGAGFGTHPHDNMEIITIPISGALEHKDSMGNHGVINAGDVQVMSAGFGVQHSEFNANQDIDANTLQIWLFPKTKNVEPRYQQISLNKKEMTNKFLQIVSPDPKDEGTWIHQDAWFHLGEFDSDKEIEYYIKNRGNGAYIFIIEGSAIIEDEKLEKRDGIGIWDTDKIKLKISKGSKVLIMDVPMIN